MEVLLHRLRGLCDNVDAGPETFDDQEVCFILRDPNQQVMLYLLLNFLDYHSNYQYQINFVLIIEKPLEMFVQNIQIQINITLFNPYRSYKCSNKQLINRFKRVLISIFGTFFSGFTLNVESAKGVGR